MTGFFRWRKSIIILCLLMVAGIIVFTELFHSSKKITHKDFETFLLSQYKKAPDPPVNKKEGKIGADRPDEAAFQEYLMTLDPATGTVPRERLIKAYRQTKAAGSLKFSGANLNWHEYFSKIGGRTRMIMYDPNDGTHRKVWAGGVTGGLWFNNNISDANSFWIPVDNFWSCLSIRCMAYDPVNPMIFYVGTGEAETAMQTYRESSGLGQGIWKSVDGGQTWNQLPSTTGFAYVTKILVRNENGNGVIYAGVASGLYEGEKHFSAPSDGLFRSSNGGISWQQVLPSIGLPAKSNPQTPFSVSDISMGADGRIYVGSRPNINGNGAAGIFWSDSGLKNSWNVNLSFQQEIMNDTNAYKINPRKTYNIPGRVVLAAAPSDPNIVYALIASGFIDSTNNFQKFYCFYILRSDDKGQTWVKKKYPTDLTSGDNFATLAWHALAATVDPNDANTVYIGGLDVQRTTNGGNTWKRVSDWTLMYAGGGNMFIHADQHVVTYKPGSSTEILFGSDGGIFYTSQGTAIYPPFSPHDNGFSTLQFYTCAINPVAGAQYFLGGLQDNGTLYYVGSPFTISNMISGGDGAYCFFDENEPSIFITSVYYNWYTFFINGQVVDYPTWYGSGIFVNPADYDYNLNTIYANAVDFVGNNQNMLLRISNISTTASGSYVNLPTNTNVWFSAVKYSPWSTTGKATLIIGTQSGRLFKIQNAQATPNTTEITGSNFPPANISSIAFGGSEDTLLVTFSNYGVPSVWQTYNGGLSWQDKEGDLPDMPVRWAVYYPDDARYALLATETGVWSTGTLDQSQTVWTPSVDGMANVRTDMLQVRKSDNTVLAATHGRGLFTANWDISTGMNVLKASPFTIFPNPSTGFIHVMSDSKIEGIMEIRIFNSAGVMLNKRTIETGKGRIDEAIDLSGLPKGEYFISARRAGMNPGTEKIILY